MSKRDLEQILQSFEEQIPELVEKRIEDTLQSLPEKKIRKPKRSWLITRWLAVGTAAAVIGGIVFVGPDVSPAIGKAVQSVFSVADPGLQYVAKAGLSTQEEIVIEDKGIKLVIKEVYADQFRTSFVYYIEDAHGKMLDPNISDIDNKTYLTNALGFKINSGGNDYTNLSRFVGKPYGVYSINYVGEEVPETLYLHINVENIHGIKGNWQKVIEIDRTQAERLAKTYKGNGTTYTLPDGVKLQFERLELQPSMARVILKTTHLDWDDSSSPVLMYKITDDQGKVVADTAAEEVEPLPLMENVGPGSGQRLKNGEVLQEQTFYGISPAKRFDFHFLGIMYMKMINQSLFVQNPKGINTFLIGNDQLIVRNFRKDQHGTYFTVEIISNDEVLNAFVDLADQNEIGAIDQTNETTWKSTDGKYHYQSDVKLSGIQLDLDQPIRLYISNVNKIVRGNWKISLTPTK